MTAADDRRLRAEERAREERRELEQAREHLRDAEQRGVPAHLLERLRHAVAHHERAIETHERAARLQAEHVEHLKRRS